MAEAKNTCWEMFFKYAHLLTGVVGDDNIDDAWALVCSLYWIGEKDVKGFNDDRHSLRGVASSQWCIIIACHKGKLSSYDMASSRLCNYGFRKYTN